MGTSSSKLARKLPRRPPTWASARIPHTPGPSSSNHVKASEHRTTDVNNDAGDPHFLSNISQLGPVRVDQRTQAVRSDPQRSNIDLLFKSRAEAEQEASAIKPTRNHLHASSIHELLDGRKSVWTEKDLETLAIKYEIDLDKFNSIARFVNSPSIDRNSISKTVDKNGDEKVTLAALWLEPPSPMETQRLQCNSHP